jgi:two-component system nitrate/nitrite response regulator NarL
VTLTERQWQIVRMVTEGMMNKEIGAAIGITELGMKNHLHRIFDVTGMNSRLELALWYLGREEAK